MQDTEATETKSVNTEVTGKEFWDEYNKRCVNDVLACGYGYCMVCYSEGIWQTVDYCEEYHENEMWNFAQECRDNDLIPHVTQEEVRNAS